MTDDRHSAEEQIVAELAAEILESDIRGEQAPAPVMARVYRALLEAGEHDAAVRHRALLHREADNGSPVASEVLELLADDPFWRSVDTEP